MAENKHPKKNAKTSESMLISGVKQVFPKESTGVKPLADNNVLKVTEHCLYALSSADRENTGRASGAWWFIWMTVFMIMLYLFTMLPDLLNGTSQNTIEEHILFGGGGLLVFIIFTIPFFIRWRRVLPICFNRKTKKVTAWIKGELLQADWDTIEAHVKTLTIGPRLGVLSVNLYATKKRLGDRTPWSLPIAGTERQSMTPQEASYMIWEYLRLFMEEGKQAIPEPVILHRINTWGDCFRVHNPFPIIREGSDTFGWKLFNILFFPIHFVLFFLSVPTELIYTALDKILPKRKPPKELLDACKAGK